MTNPLPMNMDRPVAKAQPMPPNLIPKGIAKAKLNMAALAVRLQPGWLCSLAMV